MAVVAVLGSASATDDAFLPNTAKIDVDENILIAVDSAQAGDVLEYSEFQSLPLKPKSISP